MNKKEQVFVKIVEDFYIVHGRHTLPWRKTKNPYRIHVSEVMLQQTQVDRVTLKYETFLKKFPTIQSLAVASLGEVLTQWQGLGYNRRAKMLHNCVKEIQNLYHGTYPKTCQGLVELPGIGPYTAGAILAFAYNETSVIIETNIRTVFTYHFFNGDTDVPDKEILRYIEATLNIENPREWYWALMDYGTYLKKKHGSINSKSKHYTKQSKFEGSDRQIRGAIIRVLSENKHHVHRVHLRSKLSSFESGRIDSQVKKLLLEGLISKTKQSYHLPK